MDSKSLSHTKWKCQYHIVFISKYRKKRYYSQDPADPKEKDYKKLYKKLLQRCESQEVLIDSLQKQLAELKG